MNCPGNGGRSNREPVSRSQMAGPSVPSVVTRGHLRPGTPPMPNRIYCDVARQLHHDPDHAHSHAAMRVLAPPQDPYRAGRYGSWRRPAAFGRQSRGIGDTEPPRYLGVARQLAGSSRASRLGFPSRRVEPGRRALVRQQLSCSIGMLWRAAPGRRLVPAPCCGCGIGDGGAFGFLA
jgi:hypothetical protein